MNFPLNLPGKLCCASLLVILSAALISAQQTRGTLRGLITDELGAAIVGATIATQLRMMPSRVISSP